MEGSVDVAEVAEMLKSLYDTRMRSRGDAFCGYISGNRWKDSFIKAAESCIKHGFVPLDHINALFNGVSSPQPNMLHGDAAVERTRLYMKSHPDDAVLQHHVENLRFNNLLNIGDDVVDILTSPLEDFTYSFRYAMAVKYNCASVAEKYRDLARRELKVSPGLLSVLRPLLPVSFLETIDGVKC